MFVLLVCFLRGGLIGGIRDLYEMTTRKRAAGLEPEEAAATPGVTAADEQKAARAEIAGQPPATPLPARGRKTETFSGPILEATRLTKRYGGLVANSDINFTVNHGELRGIIGPNGAGKTTFFKMLTCEVPPTSGRIVFEGRDITGRKVTDSPA